MAVAVAAAALAAGCGGQQRPAGNVVPALDYEAPPARGTPPSPAEIRAAGGNGALVVGGTDLFEVRSRRAARRLVGRTAQGSQLTVERRLGAGWFVVRRPAGTSIYVHAPRERSRGHEGEDFAAGDVVALAGEVRAAATVPRLGAPAAREVRRRGFWLQAASVEPVL